MPVPHERAGREKPGLGTHAQLSGPRAFFINATKHFVIANRRRVNGNVSFDRQVTQPDIIGIDAAPSVTLPRKIEQVTLDQEPFARHETHERFGYVIIPDNV